MEDAQIIELYRARDERSIKETDIKYGAYCRAIARGIVKTAEDTEECVYDTYLQTWNAIPPAYPKVFRLFLAKITRNLSFNRYKASHAAKRGGGEVDLVLDELAECVAAPVHASFTAGSVTGDSPQEQRVVEKELSACINRFVKALPERDGNVFMRRYFYTEPVKEIAARYSMTPTNVSVVLNRTRARLKTYLEAEGYTV